MSSLTLSMAWLLAWDRLICVFQWLLISWHFHAQQSLKVYLHRKAQKQSLDFTKNGVKNEKHSVSSSCASRNALLMREVRGEWWSWWGEMHVHVGFCSCRPSAGIWGCSENMLSQTGQLVKLRLEHQTDDTKGNTKEKYCAFSHSNTFLSGCTAVIR